jgi:hypothetical protein
MHPEPYYVELLRQRPLHRDEAVGPRVAASAGTAAAALAALIRIRGPTVRPVAAQAVGRGGRSRQPPASDRASSQALRGFSPIRRTA